MKSKKDLLNLSPLTISLIYLVVASLWILLTDRLVEFLLKDPNKITLIQTYKGWFYVVMTSLGLFYLISKHDEIKDSLSKKQEKDQELRTKLLKKIPVMITMYDPKLEKIQVNHEFTKVTGYNNIDANTIDLMKACYPDDEYREKVLQFMGKPDNGWKEVLLTTKSGNQIYNSWTNLLLADDTQVGIGINLTEIRQSEEVVRKSKNLLRSIFEGLDESVILVDLDSRTIKDCNEATEKILGYSKKELIGQDTRIIHIDEEHFHRFNEIGVPRLMKDGVYQTEFRLKKKTGEIIETDHTVTMVRDEEGNDEIVVSVVRDVTSRKQSEKNLKDSEERYRHIFQNNPQPMWVFDLRTLEFLEVNEAAINEYGYSRAEFLSMKISDIRSDTENHKLSSDLNNLDIKSDTETEWVHLKKNREEKIVNVYGTEMEFENRPARLILINDITEKKKNKELLIKSAIDGEDKERKRIAQELHDGIGQYLSAVNLNMESIKKEIENLTDRKQDRFLNTLSIIKKAMKETRALAYTLMPVELDEYGLVLAIKSLAREMEGASDVKIKTSISNMDSILNKNIKSNFYRIIQEAFNNAIKHGKATFIELSLKHENEFIYCQIKDNGKGMNTNKLKEATGLGIKSIKARTETMSGVFDIESKPGEGLEITIKVPVKQMSRI